MDTSVDFEQWYRGLDPRLHTTIRIACGSADEADEVVAEAFARASARWTRVRRMPNPDGWTYTVAVNLVRRRGRRRTRERQLALVAGTSTPVSIDTGATLRFTELVAPLPDRMREIVVLRHVADLTEPMIAEVLGISRGTVSSTLRDAHARLADRLRSDEREESP
jgi:RNA polymerase sigma-70 factor (ECF subfamily)